ncbi:MAG TPA: NUDIX domain-containing protein [Xanthobacteraceae bacterium]|jgi:predicted NUDIX family NTP pyrophosphohydrolase|nr:NUDIX domain-containing protein [Xanthobacteraceae bacterium]
MTRKAEISAGLLVFRRKPQLEVLLGHPGGPYWARKDAGAWSIPKGLVGPDGDLAAAARRELAEETSFIADGPLVALAPARQKSGKIVHAFALEADFDLAQFASNSFEIEWPPRSGTRREFPEIDRVGYFGVEEAMGKILTYQQPFIRELLEKIGAGKHVTQNPRN